MNRLLYLLFLVQKNWLSQCVGFVVNKKWPLDIHGKIKNWFIGYFKLNLSEAEFPAEHYETLGQLFIRKLKPGARPIHSSTLVSPVDAAVQSSGRVTGPDFHLEQIKGRNYTLAKLTGPGIDVSKYMEGYYSVFYLAPRDYHRIHSPLESIVRKVSHIPGKLWPVNDWSVRVIDGLFVVNERVTIELESKEGHLLLVLVGATNVGRITLEFDPDFSSNSGSQSYRTWVPPNPVLLDKGEPLGCFNMGSTVILVVDSNLGSRHLLQSPLPKSIQVGQEWRF